MTKQEKVQSMFNMFETSTRDNGKLVTHFTIEAIKSKSPEFEALQTVLFNLKDNMASDFAYECAHAYLEMLSTADLTDLEKLADDFTDTVDIYNTNLANWLAEDLSHGALVDDVLNSGQFDGQNNVTIYNVLMAAQALALRMVAEQINALIV